MRGSSARAPPIGVEVAGSVPARAVALVAQWGHYQLLGRGSEVRILPGAYAVCRLQSFDEQLYETPLGTTTFGGG
jgi:hypothetical protein